MEDLKPDEIVNRMLKYPSFIDELKPYQLEMAEDYSQRMIQRIESEKAKRLEPFMQFDPDETKQAREHASQPFDNEIKKYQLILKSIKKLHSEKRMNEIGEKLQNKFKELEGIQELNSKDIKLNENEIQALDNVCRNAKKENKRDVLTEYLKLSKSMIRADIRDLFFEKYELSVQTFYKWTQDLDKEIKSISRTQK